MASSIRLKGSTRLWNLAADLLIVKPVSDLDSPPLPLGFTIFPHANYFQHLVYIIQKCGGLYLPYEEVTDKDSVIVLANSIYLDTHSFVKVPPDVYSANFVFDVVKLDNNFRNFDYPDLNLYRISPSKYHAYDSNSILFLQTLWTNLEICKSKLQELTWKDLQGTNKPQLDLLKSLNNDANIKKVNEYPVDLCGLLFPEQLVLQQELCSVWKIIRVFDKTTSRGFSKTVKNFAIQFD